MPNLQPEEPDEMIKNVSIDSRTLTPMNTAEQPRDSVPTSAWQLDLGARVIPEGVRFRVWAPKPTRVEVVLNGGGPPRALSQEMNGYWSGSIHDAEEGMTYQYRLDGTQLCPDPCSRFQPEGPHGPSLIVDPSLPWHDEDW